MLAETPLGRKGQESVGGSNTTGTDGVGEDSLTVGTVRISTAARLNTGTIVVLRETGQTVANLVSKGINSEDSVVVGVAGGAESGKKRALSAGRCTSTTGKRTVSVHNLVESS